MKRIVTNGSTNLEPLSGSSEWYWGTDYASGDLRETNGTAEQLAVLPLLVADDCCNLILETSPLMLMRTSSWIGS